MTIIVNKTIKTITMINAGCVGSESVVENKSVVESDFLHPQISVPFDTG